MSLLDQILSGAWTRPGTDVGPKLCPRCNTHFVQFHAHGEQARCPTCRDIEQRHPTIIVARHRLAQFSGVRVESLPPRPWKQFVARPGDAPRWKMDVRGSIFQGPDVPWEGRIVIWSTWQVQPGDMVTVRHMEAIHRLQDGEETERHEYVVLAPTRIPTEYSHRRLIWWEENAYTGRPVLSLRVRGGAVKDVEYGALVVLDDRPVTREQWRHGAGRLIETVDTQRRVFSPDDPDDDDYDDYDA